jgi:hypothetical protein
MNPEELPRPKGPKVEPIDRRGKLIAFKQSVRKETAEDIPVEAPANETPYERLKRLETDPAANLKELQSTLAYFVPHLQLIEVEAILGRMIPTETNPDGTPAPAPQGLYALLMACQTHSILSGEELGLGHQVRSIRNDLFHNNSPLSELSKKLITSHWEKLREISQAGESTAVAVRNASVAPLERITDSQREAGKISHLAAFIEIEQMLRKTMSHVLARNHVLRANFVLPTEPAGSVQAMNAISLSRGHIADTLKNFKFWDDIKASTVLRHDLIHGRNLSTITQADKLMVQRAWGVLRHLPYALWAKKLVIRLERIIRDLLISEGVASEVAQRLWIQRLSRRLSEEKRCMALIASGGVGSSQILWLIDFSDAIFAENLDPVTSVDVAKLQGIHAGIEKALANPMPLKSASAGAKTRHAARKDARNMTKHPKARRGHVDDDFS